MYLYLCNDKSTKLEYNKDDKKTINDSLEDID